MHPIAFYFITLITLIYSAILIGEAHEYADLDRASNELRGYQIKVMLAERTNQFAQQLVHRVAVDSAHDAALQGLLKKNGVQVTYSEMADTPKPPAAETNASQQLSQMPVTNPNPPSP